MSRRLRWGCALARSGEPARSPRTRAWSSARFITSARPPDSCCSSAGEGTARAEALALLRENPDGVRTVAREEIPERPPWLVDESLVEHVDARHAIEAEIAEVVPQLAPRRKRPRSAPEEHAERLDGPFGGGALFVFVSEPQLAPRNERVAAGLERRRRARAIRHRRDEESRLGHER